MKFCLNKSGISQCNVALVISECLSQNGTLLHKFTQPCSGVIDAFIDWNVYTQISDWIRKSWKLYKEFGVLFLHIKNNFKFLGKFEINGFSLCRVKKKSLFCVR